VESLAQESRRKSRENSSASGVNSGVTPADSNQKRRGYRVCSSGYAATDTSRFKSGSMSSHGLPKAFKAMDHRQWHDAVTQDLYLATAAATWRYWFEANQLVDPGSSGRM
jgi:hypothetical protein